MGRAAIVSSDAAETSASAMAKRASRGPERGRDWIGSYEELEIDAEEIFDLGNGVTFGVLTMDGRPVGSTGHVRYRIAQVHTWADGKVVRVTGYQDIEEARAAAERLAQERG